MHDVHDRPHPRRRRAQAAAGSVHGPIPTSEPTRARPRPLPRSEPFAIDVTAVDVRSTANAAILGLPEAPVDEAAVRAAVATAVDELVTYLDAQLLARPTAFSAGPPAALLAPPAMAALDGPGRAGLGDLAVPGYLGTVARTAAASVRVLVHGSDVQSLLLQWEAAVDLHLEQASGVVVQRGTAALVPRPDAQGWQAVAVDAELELAPQLQALVGTRP